MLAVLRANLRQRYGTPILRKRQMLIAFHVEVLNYEHSKFGARNSNELDPWAA